MTVIMTVRDLREIPQPTMPKETKRAWLHALRSGEYGQCRSKLTDGKGNFCCLGVLQHVVSGGSCEAFDERTIDGSEFMAVPTPQWYKDNNILGIVGTPEETLTCMNDEYSRDSTGRIRRASFKTIANWIERNVMGI